VRNAHPWRFVSEKISKAEQAAIRQVVEHGRAFGFGNLITHLQTAWAVSLMEQGMDEETARHASGGGYPLLMWRDLMERGEWDETGKRYKTTGKALRTSR
jgi:hypothetical protein